MKIPPGFVLSIGSASCLIFISGRVELMAHAELVLAAGWVGGATTLAMEGIGGVTTMAAGMAESAGVCWEGGAAVVRREGRGWEPSWEGGGPTCWCCCSVPWLGIVSIGAATDGARLVWISGLGFTLPKSLRLSVYNAERWFKTKKYYKDQCEYIIPCRTRWTWCTSDVSIDSGGRGVTEMTWDQVLPNSSTLKKINRDRLNDNFETIQMTNTDNYCITVMKMFSWIKIYYTLN